MHPGGCERYFPGTIAATNPLRFMNIPEISPNRRLPSSLSRPLAEWPTILREGWSRASATNMGLIAAGVAFYLFLAMVPVLGSIIMLYGIFADPVTVATHLARLSQTLPASAADIVSAQIEGIVTTKGATKGLALAGALALALFGARNAAGSMIVALNVAFGCKETRSLVGRNLVALAITAGGALATVLLFAGIGVFGFLQAAMMPGSALSAGVGQVLTALLVVMAISAAIAILFHYGPACRQPSLRWLSPGAILAALVIAALTVGFGVYVANFGNYNATYGALGGVVVLLTWMWLTSYAVLIGASCEAALLDEAKREAAP